MTTRLWPKAKRRLRRLWAPSVQRQTRTAPRTWLEERLGTLLHTPPESLSDMTTDAFAALDRPQTRSGQAAR